MTATAVCSVSSSPPILLCCINRDNLTRDAFVAASGFAVNILAAEDEDLANRFAMRMPHAERFSSGGWRLHSAGIPVLDTAATWFACRTVEMQEVGSHTVFFGEVIDAQVRAAAVTPLLYGHGGYGRFTNSAQTTSA